MVYYIEDDTNIRELCVYALKQANIEAEGFSDDAEFRVACARCVPDVVLLDVMLPDVDGMQILQRIRRTPGLTDVPVMMITAKDTEFDTVRALDGGADDYLTKPFGLLEMVSRVRVLLRRASRGVENRKNEVLSVGPFLLWPKRREVTIDGEELVLTQREFDLLEFFMRAPGEVFSREELLQRVWGWDYDGASRTVDVHVQQLRSKIGGYGKMIETVRGVGYRMRG